MELSRRKLLRKLLSGAGFAAIAVPLADCSTTQIQNFEAQWAQAQVWIAQSVQAVTKVLPTVESIAAVAAGFFGPQYATLVTAGSGLANQIVAALVAVIQKAQAQAATTPTVTPNASAKLGAMMKGAAVSSVVVGNTGPLPYAWQGVTVSVVK